MTTLAAIDCSTDSLRLLISRVEVVDGVLEIMKLHQPMEIVHLGQGVGAAGMLAPEALERVRKALAKCAEPMQAKKVQAVRMVVTSMTRDASNRNGFFAVTHEILTFWGAEAEVIVGEEEAALSFHGAVSDLELELGSYCVADVGGGSTEVIVGDHDGTVASSDSVAMDSVRLTERFLQSPLPTVERVQKAHPYAAELTDEIVRQVSVNKARTIVGRTGTFTASSALTQGLEAYGPETIHLSQLHFMMPCALIASIAEADAESLVVSPVIHPKRAGVFAGGSIIVDDPMNMSEALPLSEAAKEE